MLVAWATAETAAVDVPIAGRGSATQQVTAGGSGGAVSSRTAREEASSRSSRSCEAARPVSACCGTLLREALAGVCTLRARSTC